MGSPKTSHMLAIASVGIATITSLDSTPESMTMRCPGIAYSSTTRQITTTKRQPAIDPKSVLGNLLFLAIHYIAL